MSDENIEIVRAAIDAANQRDWDGAFKDVAPGFVWDNSRARGPDNRAVFSAEEAREFFRGAIEMWEGAVIEIDEVIPVGDHVVLPHRVQIRGRDGIELSVHTTWLFTIREGVIERVCLYQEKEEALNAARLAD
jgi:ketosteroid isomerase-like protein